MFHFFVTVSMKLKNVQFRLIISYRIVYEIFRYAINDRKLYKNVYQFKPSGVFK